MRLLVLGGTRFVGRTLVETALMAGHHVTAVHRGVTGRLPDGVDVRPADRTQRAALAAALGGESWDAVVDTWSAAPSVVRDAAELLRGRVGRYGYVSSRSVYRWPPAPGRDETAPVVDADPDAASTDYAADKRGAELAVLARHPDPLLLRAGLILGPYEDVGRLPWWLGRIARGGRVVAPGRPGRPLQYVDVRDLATFALDRLATDGGTEPGRPATDGTGSERPTGGGGVFDLTGPPGQCTTADLLEACQRVTGSTAELVWRDDAAVAASGAQPWTELPCWVPETEEYAGFFAADTSLAHRAGLRDRPVQDTVAATWAWLQAEGWPPPRLDRPPVGLPAEVEGRLLAAG